MKVFLICCTYFQSLLILIEHCSSTKKVEQHGLASFSLSYLKWRMVIVSCLKCVYVRRLMAFVCNGDIQYHMMLKKIFKPDQGEISFGTLLSSFCFWICFCSWGNSKRVLLVLLSEEKKPWMEETQSGVCLADRLALSHSQEEGKIRTPITLNSMSYPFLPTFHQTSQDLDFCERKQECYKKRDSSWLQLLTGSRLYWSCLVLNVENQKTFW